MYLKPPELRQLVCATHMGFPALSSIHLYPARRTTRPAQNWALHRFFFDLHIFVLQNWKQHLEHGPHQTHCCEKELAAQKRKWSMKIPSAPCMVHVPTFGRAGYCRLSTCAWNTIDDGWCLSNRYVKSLQHNISCSDFIAIELCI